MNNQELKTFKSLVKFTELFREQRPTSKALFDEATKAIGKSEIIIAYNEHRDEVIKANKRAKKQHPTIHYAT